MENLTNLSINEIQITEESMLSVRSSKQKQTFAHLPLNIIAETLFFFLDIDDICKSLLLINKSWHKAYKMHLNVWIYIMSDETKHFEILNGDIVDSIWEKRLKFYEDYEIDPPSKDLAVQLLD